MGFTESDFDFTPPPDMNREECLAYVQRMRLRVIAFQRAEKTPGEIIDPEHVFYVSRLCDEVEASMLTQLPSSDRTYQ